MAAIFLDDDVPEEFTEDVALNALVDATPADFQVPDVQRLRAENEVSKLR